MKKRVLHIVDDLKTGGLERVIALLLSGADRKRFSPEVWALARGGAIADELRAAGEAVRICGLTTYHNPLNFIRLIRLLKRHKPDIVHTHGYFGGTFGRIAAFAAGVPQMFHHIHTTHIGGPSRNHAIERLLSRVTQRIICCSGAVRDFVIAEGRMPPNKLVVVYNGVKPKVVTPDDAARIRQEFGIQEDERVVGCTASLGENKGHTVLLKAAGEILPQMPRAKFLFVGDGPCRKELERQASEGGMASQVIFAGRRDDVFPLVSVMDLLVLPSRYREGLGLSIIEAMSMAKPVVASRIGGIPEVVRDGETGLLVPPADSGQLAQAVARLLKEPKTRKDMGLAGYARFVSTFTAAKMVEQVERLYDGVDPGDGAAS
jgi:glycosyltransferase involved in cell wall biosynthesis